MTLDLIRGKDMAEDELKDCIHRKEHGIECKLFDGSCAMIQARIWNAIPGYHKCLYYLVGDK